MGECEGECKGEWEDGELDADCIGCSGLGLAKMFLQHVCTVCTPPAHLARDGAMRPKSCSPC